MQDAKNRQKVTIWSPSHNFVALYLCNYGMYRQSKRNLLSSDMSSQYGELRPTNGWDPSGSLRHPSKFQRVSHLGFVTAWHSSSGRQPNFVALNRGRHLYSAGRPSRWALAHILVLFIFIILVQKDTLSFKVLHFHSVWINFWLWAAESVFLIFYTLISDEKFVLNIWFFDSGVKNYLSVVKLIVF